MASGTDHSAIPNVEVHGFFVSRVKAFLAVFLFLSLLIALVVLAALLAHERGKEKFTRVAGNPAGTQGKRNRR